MNLLLTKCLQLILIIMKYQLVSADKTMARLGASKIMLNGGRMLEAQCGEFTAESEYDQNADNFFSSDIYICRNDSVDHAVIIENSQYDATWIHVFVKSQNSPFAKTYQIQEIRGSPDTIGTVPCELSPHGEKSNNQADVFRRRERIILENVKPTEKGLIICKIHPGGDLEEIVTFRLQLTVIPETVDQPRVKQISPLHTVYGADLQLTCSVGVQNNWNYTLSWITPKNMNNKIEHRDPSTPLYDRDTMMRELKIQNVSAENTGNYTCEFSVLNKSRSSTKFITIHDPNFVFVNLTRASKNSNYSMEPGSNITWVAYYNGYPPPEIRWLDPKNITIANTTNKYHVAIRPDSTTLKIFDLRIADMGVYTVEARSADKRNTCVQNLTHNLTILSKPILIGVMKVKDYYEQHEDVEFVCVFEGYPQPTINWTFQDLHKKQKLEIPNRLELPTSAEKSLTQFNSTAKMEIVKSGTLSCVAYNEYGNDSYEYPIFIADVPNGFGIIEPRADITVGDDVELICRGSIYHFKNSIEWYSNESHPIPIKNSVSEQQTPYSYESILRMKDMNKSHENSTYICKVSTTEGDTRTDKKTLHVNDPVPPFFINTNMNGTEIIYDTATARRTVIILRCYGNGMPRPVISWFRNGQILKVTEDLYSFMNESHELQIKHPHTSDSGEYTCKLKNRLNAIQRHQIITIRDETISKASIISIVILLVLCVILVIYFTIKMHREKTMRKQLMEAGLTHFEKGALEYLNPELTVDDQADLLPYDKKWEFPRERLKFGKQLGCGAFGVVMKAQADRIRKNELSTTVAVKMVKRSTEPTYIKALASELKIMVHVGKHLNVVNLLGACTRNIAKRELLVIVEYCRFGNLHNYLLRHRSDFINQIDPVTRKIDLSIGRELLMQFVNVGIEDSINPSLSSESEINYASNPGPEESTSEVGLISSNDSVQPGWRSNYNGDYKELNLKPICTQDLLSWAFQVARGMEYLSQRKILHGDLAARNILLAENSIVKICDFGLARAMYKNENYEKKGKALLPIKWMAIESIRDRVFSTQSDVWSFGIVLWEFFSLAETPYAGLVGERQYRKLIEGYRMENPEFSPDDIYDIMLKCWRVKPSARPTFTDLVQSIGNLLDENVKTHYLDLNTPYMDMNAKAFESEESDYLTMMSAPDHGKLTSRTEREYVNLPNLSTRSNSGRVSDRLQSDIPGSQPKSTDTCELTKVLIEPPPELKTENDNYLQPINVQERRAEFVRQHQAKLNIINDNQSKKRHSDYCNSSRNSQSAEMNDGGLDANMNILRRNSNDKYNENHSDNSDAGVNKHGEDNHVDMSAQKLDLEKDSPDCFTNPSYLFMTNTENDITRL